MEKMSARETKLLHDLAAKQKRIQRADSEFFKNVEERRDEVLEHLGVSESNKLSEIARMYGTDEDTLYTILSQPAQIDAFKAAMQQEQETASYNNAPDENDNQTSSDSDSYY